MHPLAERQLRRYFKDALPVDERFQAFARAVSDAYCAADDDREMLERTLALASKETEERYDALQLDIARRQRAEGERDAFFRTSPDMLAIVDSKLAFVQVNESWQVALGFEPASLVGRSFFDLVHPEDVEKVKVEAGKVAQTGSVKDFEFRLRTITGELRWVSSAATIDPTRGLFFCVARDVTQQREMSRELAQAHKLEAVGQLASGVAHEINTPVQYVGDNVQFAADGFGELFTYLDAVQGQLTDEQKKALAEAERKADLEYLREELPRSLEEAKDGVRRVAELVRALKEFAHPDQADKAAADINKALERAVVLARGELKHISRVETDFGELPIFKCHIGGLSQVFLNLLVNAAHAIEERTQKFKIPWEDHRIGIKTRVEGGDIVISISDTGCGIPENIRERIYEPFFTTKPMGKGSGQGLPLVRNVVMGKHGGRIDLDTTVDQGSTFILRLPIEPTAALARAA
jgi:two-component system, NtrC family, sensor kinase